MFAWVPRIAAIFFVLFVACGADETVAPMDPSENETERDHQAEELTTEELDLEDEELIEDEALLEVDEMDEHGLEAACFAGQQAACDQLGH